MDAVYSFGAWVRRRRRSLDLTQAGLARAAGIATITVQKIEADERRPSAQVAVLLGQHLHVPLGHMEQFLAVARGELAVDHLPNYAHTGSAQSDAIHVSLPVQRTSFFGRQRDVAEILRLIRDGQRLITLTGAGGSGKTRLAIHVAALMHDHFRDGVWFIDLTSLTDPALVTRTIATVLGIPDLPGTDVLAQLHAVFAAKRTLLVLDNFEQIIEGASEIARLVDGASELTIICTSRIPLRVSGEQEFPVMPLAVPSDKTLSATEIAAIDSVALFLARARAVRPALVFTDENAWAIAAMCRRLQGMPLAIELVATHIRIFTPSQLLERLEVELLQMLTGATRDAPARHQTIRATIDWSYRLLGTAEQLVLARLGVFVGGWTLHAAQAICSHDSDNVVHALNTLSMHTLVYGVEVHGEMRFEMLETVREYANERLYLGGDVDQLRSRHFAYYAEWAAKANPRLRTADQRHWMNLFETESPNLEAALRYSLQPPNETLLAVARFHDGLRLLLALTEYWRCAQHFRTWDTWYQHAYESLVKLIPHNDKDLALEPQLADVYARILIEYECARGSTAQPDDFATRDERIRRIESFSDLLNDSSIRHGALVLRAGLLSNQSGTEDTVRPLLEEALALSADDPYLYGGAVDLLISRFGGAAPWKAVELAEQFLVRAARTGEPLIIQEAHWLLGFTLFVAGSIDRAETHARDALAIADQFNGRSEASVLYLLMQIAGTRGDYNTLSSLNIRRYAIEQNLGLDAGMLDAQVVLAQVFADQSNFAGASHALDIADTHAHALHGGMHLMRCRVMQAHLCMEQGNLVLAQEQLNLVEHSSHDLDHLDYHTRLYWLRRGELARAVGRHEQARQYFQEVVMTPPTGWLNVHIRAHTGLGLCALDDDRANEAIDHFEQALAHAEHGTWLIDRADAMLGFARAVAVIGDTTRAVHLLQPAFADYRQMDAKRRIATGLESLASIAAQNPDAHESAACLWGAAAHLRTEIGASMWPVDRCAYETAIASVGKVLGDEAFQHFWRKGAHQPWEQSVDDALKHLGSEPDR